MRWWHICAIFLLEILSKFEKNTEVSVFIKHAWQRKNKATSTTPPKKKNPQNNRWYNFFYINHFFSLRKCALTLFRAQQSDFRLTADNAWYLPGLLSAWQKPCLPAWPETQNSPTAFTASKTQKSHLWQLEINSAARGRRGHGIKGTNKTHIMHMVAL